MKHLFGICALWMWAALQLMAAGSKEKEVVIKLIETSDVHGNFFPYNFIERKEWRGSLARVASYVDEQRKLYGDRCLLVDNGDILQGQPTAYYYNFMDTTSVHLTAAVLNRMGYVAGTMGNHDIETGHAVYDRWVRQCNFPVLGANILDAATGKPYLPPYVTLERDGVKVTILGMVTPSIPSWLPEKLWSGLRFEDMVTCARKWVPVIQQQEQPDFLVGLFHSGQAGNFLGGVVENGSKEVAQQVPGFDVVLMGHDHAGECRQVTDAAGGKVWLLDPANHARVVAEVTLKAKRKGNRVVEKSVEGRLVDMDAYPVSAAYMDYFRPQFEEVERFVSRQIGSISRTISGKNAYFGSSAFIDLIHELQLNITGADLSFTAPLTFAAEIKQGPIFVSDMFNLYKYENMLYVMELTGQEVKDYLEMSYAGWTNRMTSPDDHLLLFKQPVDSKLRARFLNPSFNFDSAAGIRYTVDVTRPEGEKITIECMADGTPFELQRRYKVAVNSYRGNGGGDLLTKGAGILKEDLKNRIIFATDKDLRYYLMKYIEQHPVLEPRRMDQWKFIPEEWVVPAAKRDYRLLFGEEPPQK